MNEYGEILTRLGRIEGRLDGIREVIRAGPEAGNLAILAERGVGRAGAGFICAAE